MPRLPRALAWALTMLCFVVSLVYFRAADMAAAGRMIAGMMGAAGFALPSDYAALLGGVAPALQAMGVTFAPDVMRVLGLKPLVSYAVLLAMVLLLPNVQEFMARYRPALGLRRLDTAAWWRAFAFRPRPAFGFALGALFAAAAFVWNLQSPFLYFQF
jgi:hypothetical protein